jgi:hypothetical protein
LAGHMYIDKTEEATLSHISGTVEGWRGTSVAGTLSHKPLQVPQYSPDEHCVNCGPTHPELVLGLIHHPLGQVTQDTSV